MLQSFKALFAPNYIHRLGGILCSTVGFLHLTFGGDVGRSTALFAAAIYFELVHQTTE